MIALSPGAAWQVSHIAPYTTLWPKRLADADRADLTLLIGNPERDGTRIVELRFFGGLDTQATPDALGVSTRTVERAWRAARAWLLDRVAGSGAD